MRHRSLKRLSFLGQRIYHCSYYSYYSYYSYNIYYSYYSYYSYSQGYS